MKNNFPAKRCWMITDIHFGARANSVEWIDIQKDYFENFFIPLVEREYRKGDVLLVLGDIFDSRHSINLMVLNLALDVFSKLSKIFADGIIVILGNHDCYLKSSNEINSVRCLSFIPNINIYEEPSSIKIGERKFLLMPWRKSAQDEAECIKTMSGTNEYLLMHTDVKGFKHNKHSDIVTGCELSTYKQFKKVYSGHIHYAQHIGNVNMLGSPFEITRSDRGNTKGVTILDLDTEKETFFENKHSPRFLMFNFADVIEMTPEKMKRLCKNNFVDIVIDYKNILKAPINILVDLLENNYRALEFKPQNDAVVQMPDNNVQYSEFNISNAIKEYVTVQSYDEDTKSRMLLFLNELYSRAEKIQTSSENEN